MTTPTQAASGSVAASSSAAVPSSSVPAAVQPVAGHRKMPQPGEKNAPKFELDKSHELLRFFERMDDWFSEEGIQGDTERKKRLVRYTDVETERQWKALPEFTAGTYEALKAKLLMLYPRAEELGRGSVDNLKKKMRGIGEIGVNDRDTLLSLIRIVTAELSKLKDITPPIHTNRELVEMFLGCLSKRFAASVAQKLSIHRVSATVAAVTGQGGQNSPRNPEDMFDIVEVMEIARLTSVENANPFARYLALPSGQGDSRETAVKLEETTAAVAALKDAIVLQQQNYKLIDQKLSTLANVRAQNQSQSQNSAYNARPVYSNAQAQQGTTGAPCQDGCFYCGTPGCRINICESVKAHMDKGWIIRVAGYLKLPNGSNIPKDGRPMKQTIEELNKPKPGLIQMARIPKEHFYQGAPQAESYIQMQAADPEEEASRVLIELMHKVGVGNLQRALQKENFHLATEDNDDEAEQGFY